jgi:hypothetical protein
MPFAGRRHARLCVHRCEHRAEVVVLQVQPIVPNAVQSSAALLWCPRECRVFSSTSSSITMWFWTREEWCSNTPPAQMRSLTKWRDIFSFGGPNCAIAAAGYVSGISTENEVYRSSIDPDAAGGSTPSRLHQANGRIPEEAEFADGLESRRATVVDAGHADSKNDALILRPCDAARSIWRQGRG